MSSEEEYSIVVTDGVVLGNTQYVAYQIKEHTNVDVFRIEPITPYPMNHAELERVIASPGKSFEIDGCIVLTF